jgi:hypothetical protein
MNREQVGALVLGAAVFAGTCRFSVPAKDDAVAEEATFNAKCAGYYGYGADVQKMRDADLRASSPRAKARWLRIRL